MTVVDQDALFALLRDTANGSVPSETTNQLLEVALEEDGRSALIALVNRRGLTNAAQIAIVQALRDTLQPTDVPKLARAVARRHPSVVLAALPLLEASRSSAALFAVRKPLLRGEREVDEACARAAARLAAEVDAERYVRRDGVPPDDYSGRDLAYAAAAAAPETLAAIRERGADARFAEQLGRGIQELLGDLAAQNRTGSLIDFDTRLRDELHEGVLLTGIPADPAQQDRSLENLFRRRDLGDVSDLAPQLPEPVVTRYAARALRRSNRHSQRADRAVLALGMLERVGTTSDAELHLVVLECLDEADPMLAGGATKALAAHSDDLSAADRQRVVRRFGTLPAAMQRELAPALSGLATSAEEELDVDSFLRWVDGATDEERPARLRALRARWDTTVVTPEQATSFVSTLARGIHMLPASEQPGWRADLVEGALSWMYRHEAQVLGSARALLAWPGFGALVLEDLDLAISLLRAEQARALLIETLRQADDPSDVVVSITHAEVGDDELQRILVPVLAEALRHDMRAGDAAFQRAQPFAQRRLLQSALILAGQTKRRIDGLGQTTQDAADAATAQHGAAVISALRDAEYASEGNESIQGHFDAIGRAVEAVLASHDATAVPEGVVRWRIEIADRFPTAVEASDGGRGSLRFRDQAPVAEVMRILSELDQRVHSSRVVSAEERLPLRQDLIGCIDYVVEKGLVDGVAGVGLSNRPALGQLIWARWAERSPDAAGDLSRELSKPVDPRGRQQALMRIDALAGHAPDDAIAEVVDAVPPHALATAWSVVTAGLANRIRQVASLEQEVKSRGVEVMERVAERLDPPLRAIEGLMVGYFRLRSRLSAAGWRPIEERLGKELRYDELDANKHEIDGSAEAERFVVRSMGVQVRGRPVRRAVVEPLDRGSGA